MEVFIMMYDKLKEMIDNSSNIVFLGGAGTSTESNIPDFRSGSGLYRKNVSLRPEELLSHSFFKSHPDIFYEFYKKNLIFKDAKPNAAHFALAELEKRGKLTAIVTQNIDGLHQMAGSANVLELHGTVYKNYCMGCGEKYTLEYILSSDSTVPRCQKCGGIVRPKVVLYEENLDSKVLNDAVSYIQNADMLIVGGTSLVVYPAAGLVDLYNGNRLVLINKDSTPYDNKADLIIHDSIGAVLNAVTSEN
jgi:NAD-dependent deacetylase